MRQAEATQKYQKETEEADIRDKEMNEKNSIYNMIKIK